MYDVALCTKQAGFTEGVYTHKAALTMQSITITAQELAFLKAQGFLREYIYTAHPVRTNNLIWGVPFKYDPGTTEKYF
jgi:hypothetical protein